MDSFPVYISSGADGGTTRKNSATEFQNTLPKELALNNKYKIAVQSLIIDNKFATIPIKVRNAPDHFVHFAKLADYANDLPYKAKVSLTSNNYTAYTLITYLNSKFDNSVRFSVHKKITKGVIATFHLQIILRDTILLMHPLIAEHLGFNVEMPAVGTGPFNGDGSGNDYITFTAVSQSVQFIGNKNYPSPTAIPNLIKIRLKEMRPCLSGKGYHQEIALINGTKIALANPFSYEVKKKEYFPFRADATKTLTVELVNENNELLDLIDEADPTIITFKFKKMLYESFVLRLSSSDSSSFFVNNTNSNFQINLREPIGKHQEVALSYVYFPRTLNLQKMLLARPPHALYLHCNFIHAAIVGDQMMKVLQVIPFSAIGENMVHFEPKHQIFNHFCANDHNQLQFEIRTFDNKPVFFQDNTNVLINLVFR